MGERKALIRVYWARWDEGMDFSSFYFPPARLAQMERMASPCKKKEMAALFALLNVAVESEGLGPLQRLHPTLLTTGRWKIDGTELSMSHEAGVVAVAFSLLPIGIDLVKLGDERLRKDSMKRIVLHGEEKIPLDLLFAYKEAIYKIHGVGPFCPWVIDTTKSNRSLFNTNISIERLSLVLAGAVEANATVDPGDWSLTEMQLG